MLAFVPLLVICITGSILVFKHEIDALLRQEQVRVTEEGSLGSTGAEGGRG